MAQKAFFIPETPPYVVPIEIYEEAYRLYQRRFLLWKNRILELLLLLLGIDFTIAAFKDPTNMMAYFLLLLCVLLLVLVIFQPMRVRRRVMDVVKQMEEIPYIAALSEESIVIRTLPMEGEEEVPPTVLPYDKHTKIIEAENFFLICEGKERFYVLPKKALYDEQIFSMRRFLGQKMGKRFTSKF